MIRSRFVRRLAIGIGAIAALILLAGLALHTPPMRALVLRWALERAGADAGVRIDTGRVTYNLAVLSATAQDITVTALDSETPFFRADIVRLNLPWTILTGALGVQSLVVDRPQLVIVRNIDGTLNLPATRADSSAEGTSSIDIGHLAVNGLGVRFEDRSQNLSVAASSIDLNLSSDAGRALIGRLTASAPITISAFDRQTAVTRLDGGLAFDGSTLTVEALTIEAPEMRMAVDGRVQLLAAVELHDVRLEGAFDLARISAWMSPDASASGEIGFAGTANGSLDSPNLEVNVGGDRIAWSDLENLSFGAHAVVSGTSATIDSLHAGIAGGEVMGDARIPLDNSRGRAQLRWRNVDVGMLAAALAELPVALASTADGRAALDWNGMDIWGAAGSVENRSRSARVTKAIGLDGLAILRLEDGRWQLAHEHRIADATTVSGQMGGHIDPETLASTTLTGRTEVRTTLRSGLHQVRSAGMQVNADLASHLDGDASAVATLGGTIGSPSATGTIDVVGLRWGATEPGHAHAAFSATPSVVMLEAFDAAIGANTLAGRATLNLRANTVRGNLAADLQRLDRLAREVPERWRPDGSLRADAEVSGVLDNPTVSANLSSTGLRVAGQTVTSLIGRVSMADGVVNVDALDIAQDAGRLTSSGRYVPSSRRFEVDISGDDLTIAPVPESTSEESPFRIDARFNVRLSGGGTLDAPHMSGFLDFSRLAVEGYRVGPTRIDLETEAGAARALARMPELNASLHANLDINEPRPFTADFTLAGTSLARLVDQGRSETRVGESPLEAQVDGSVSLRLDARGNLSDLEDSNATLEVTLENASVNGARIRLERPAEWHYANSEITAESFELYVGDAVVSARGSFGTDSAAAGALQIRLAGPLSDLVPIARMWPALDEVAASGSIDATASASGPLKAPRFDATFSVASASAWHGSFPAITDLTLHGDYTAGLLQLRELRARWQDSAIFASGQMPAAILGEALPEFYRRTLPERSRRMHANLRVESLTPKALAPFFGEEALTQIAGRVDIAATVEADRLDVEGIEADVTFERAELTLAGVPLRQTQPTRLGLAGGRLDVVRWTWGGAGNQIDVSGHTLLGGDAHRLDLAANGKIDLRMLGAFSPDVVTEGLAALDVTIKGTTQEPAIEGRLALNGGGVVIRSPRMAITDLAGIITFAGEELRLDGITANANGGTVRLAGNLSYPGFELKGGTISLTGRGLALEVPDNLRTEIDVDVRLEPTGNTPTISGRVNVLRGSYREAISLAAQLLTTVETRRAVPTAGDDEPGLVDSVALDVAVSTSEDVSVDNNYGRFDVGSDLRLVGTLGEPVPTGRLTIREGGDIFLGGRTYEVARGTVDFLSRARTEPTLDLALQTRVQRYDITLEVSGTPETLEANLRSPGLSQTDIVSLLLTGQLAETGALYETRLARDQLLLLLSGELLGMAGRTVGLDSVQIGRGLGGAASDFDLLATDTDPSARLTIGKDLSRDVSVVFSRGLSDSGDITWIAIYRPLENIEIRGATQDDGSRSYEFRHELEFGGSRIAPAETRAGARQPVERVASVRIIGTPGFEERALRNRLRLEEGDRFDFYQWQRDRDRLERFFRDAGYLEARISARRSTLGSTNPPAQDLRLEYDVQRGPKTSLTIEGYRLPDAVISEIERAWAWTVFDDFLIDDIEALVRKELVAEGYLQAAIDADIAAPSSEDAKAIVVRIVPGTRFDDRHVVISGDQRFSAEVLEMMKAAGLAERVWMEPDTLRTAIERYYRSRGYLRVSVAVQPLVFTGQSASLPVRIDAGPLFTIASLEVIGNERRLAADVRSAFGVETGSPYLPGTLEPARRAVEADYLRNGYADARVAMSALVDEGRSQVDVVLRIDEGAQQVLADVAIAGANMTHATVIDRALDLQLGEPASVLDLPRAEKRLYDTGVFRTAGIAFEPLNATETGVQQVRAQVTVAELPPYRFRYGFRLNDDMNPADAGRETRPALVIDLLRRNVFGRAISAGAAGQIEPDRRLARGVVALPRFFGLPVTTSFFMTASRQTFTPEGETPFVENETSITAEQRLRPTASTSVSYGYTFSRTRIFDPEPVPGLPGLDLQAHVARLTSTFAWDRRDDPFAVRNGWFHTSGLEFGPASLGSDLRFIRYLGQQYYFKALGRGIGLASGVRIGFGRGFGQDLIRSEKFYVGGGTSVRGFAEDGIGDVDFLGDPVGGNSMLILNQELRFPIYKWFGGVAFIDAGNTFRTAGDFAVTDLEAGGGAGMRFDSPVGLLRVDLGFPITDRQRQRASRWYFGIGHAF